MKKMMTKIKPTLHFKEEISTQKKNAIIAAKRDTGSKNVEVNQKMDLRINPRLNDLRTDCASILEASGTGNSNANFGSIKSMAAKSQIWQ